MPQESTLVKIEASGRLPEWVTRMLMASLLLIVAGCASQQTDPEATPDIEITATEPVPVPEGESEPPPASPPAAVVEPAPEPLLPAAEPLSGRIAVVLSDRTPAYENVAIELGHLLDHFLLYNLADKSLSPEAVFSGIADSNAEVVIAIGLRAAERAMTLSTIPVVFCQVFNIDTADTAVPVKGVSAIPPLSLQVKAWKQLDPNLKDIGAILGEGHDDLIAEARSATAENDIDLHYRVATSDRETLYMFNRMAPDIDGFWLFPDNRVLSVSILEEMLTYARRHQVQIAVFNPSLLEMGAALSAATVDADIAATAVSIAKRIIDGDLVSIPAMTSLHEVDIRTTTTPRSGAKGSL